MRSGPAILLQATMPLPYDHFDGPSSSKSSGQYSSSMSASDAAPLSRPSHEAYGHSSTYNRRAYPLIPRERAPIERPSLPSFRELDLMTESRYAKADQASTAPSLPSLSRSSSFKPLASALSRPTTERVDSRLPATRRLSELDGDARGLPSPFYPNAFSRGGPTAEQQSGSYPRPDVAPQPRLAHDGRLGMSYPCSTHDSRLQDGERYMEGDARLTRPRRRSDEGSFSGNADHDANQAARRPLDTAWEDEYPHAHQHHAGPQTTHYPKVGGGSTPTSPRWRTERPGSRHHAVDHTQEHGQPLSGTRFRALSTNDRPLRPLGSVEGGSSLDRRPPQDGTSHIREPMRRYSLGRKGDASHPYYHSPVRTSEYHHHHHDEAPHPVYTHGGEGRYAANGLDEEASSAMDPRRGGYTHRGHRFRPYSTGEGRHLHGTPLMNHHSADGFSSSRTSPTTSAASSPPLKAYGAGARGLVGLADSTATLSTVDERQYDHEGPAGMLADNRGDYGPGSSPEAMHSTLRMGDATPHNMKRTRNGYKYSCGVAGPACHMAGCPVKEITEEYEYLKSIPEKDRWRPLVIPLGNRNHPQHVADYLKRWRLTHYDEPYLTKELSEHLRICLGLREEKQMSDWMTNARRRY